jgi:AcrR family transcriptional regulator
VENDGSGRSTPDIDEAADIAMKSSQRRVSSPSQPSSQLEDESAPASRLNHPRKRQIMHAFRMILIREGYPATSMRSVAEECGMKLGGLQYYYRTREDLLDAFISHWISLEQAGRTQLLTESNASIDGILRWIESALAHFSQRDFENAIATTELFAMAHHCDRTRAHLIRWYEDELQYYAMTIRTAIPGCSKRDSESRASALMALLEGLVMQVALRAREGRDPLMFAQQTLLESARAVLEAPIPTGS